VTEPGIFVPTEVRENLIEEGIKDAHSEVQSGADRRVVEADRGGGGERKIDAAGVQGSGDHCDLPPFFLPVIT
jgi:hypothetical protein